MLRVFWWSRPKLQQEGLENFGDYLVPYLLKRTTTKKFKWINPRYNRRILSNKHYLTIGSILHFATEDSIVWGTGMIDKSLPVKNAKFLAVRGPLTRNNLIERGFKVPEKFGDPAILLKLFTFKNKEKKYKLGVVPHTVDYEETQKKLMGIPGVLVIDLRTINPEAIINEIISCERILSSSLHGIIVSHALGVPALWTKISNRLYGDNIKFYDYYSSIKIDSPPVLSFTLFNVENAELIFEKYAKYALPDEDCFRKLISDLIETFPFKKSIVFKKAIKAFYSFN